MRLVALPFVLAILLCIWFVFSPPIRPVPTLVAITVVGAGAWMQIAGGRHSALWVAGIVIHVGFCIFALIRRKLTEY